MRRVAEGEAASKDGGLVGDGGDRGLGVVRYLLSDTDGFPQ